MTLVIAHINLYLDNPHQASISYPFSSINTSVNTDTDARCGQGLTNSDKPGSNFGRGLHLDSPFILRNTLHEMILKYNTTTETGIEKKAENIENVTREDLKSALHPGRGNQLKLHII